MTSIQDVRKAKVKYLRTLLGYYNSDEAKDFYSEDTLQEFKRKLQKQIIELNVLIKR